MSINQSNQIHENQIKQVETFFHDYARDFDSIYSAEKAKTPWRQLIDDRLRSSMTDRYAMAMQVLLDESVNSILDVGCGPGRYVYDLARENKEILALDVAQGMLDLSKENLTKGNVPVDKVKYVLGDFLATRLDKKYDAAVLIGLFDYTPDPLAVIKKLKTEVNSFFVASFPDNVGPLAWQRKIRYSLRRCPLFLYSHSDVDSLMKSAGITKYKIQKLNREYFLQAWIN